MTLPFLPMPADRPPTRHARGRWPARSAKRVATHAPLGHARAFRRVARDVKPTLEIEWSMPEVVTHDC